MEDLIEKLRRKAKKIKVIVSDIDGTLYSHKTHSVPESARIAFTKLQEKGYKVFIASGRNYYLIRKSGILNWVTPDGLITMNGATVLLDGKAIYQYPIPEDVVDTLIKFSKRLRFGLTLVEENAGHINYVDERVINSHEPYGVRFPQPRTFPDHYDRVVYQAIAFCDELDESLFLPHLRDCKSARWEKYAVDIMPSDSDKSKGVLAILEHLKLKPENVLSIGDNENDLEMLAFSGIGISMGNGRPENKAIADYVTDDIDKDGWANIMYKLGLIEKK